MSGFARRHRVLVVVLAVVGVLSLGVAAVGVVAYCTLAGCTGTAEPFDPDGTQASSARASATTQLSGLADRLVAGHEVLADGTADGCVRGQNNWKRKDAYSYECSVLVSRLVLVTTDRDAVGDALTAADAAIVEVGCRRAYDLSGLDQVRDGYWDDSNPQVQQHGAAGLPGASYRCAGDVEVGVTPTSRDARTSDPALDALPLFLEVMLHEDWYTPADIATLQRSGAELALVVTVRSTYYRTRF
jgi:hypothetical protein